MKRSRPNVMTVPQAPANCTALRLLRCFAQRALVGAVGAVGAFAVLGLHPAMAQPKSDFPAPAALQAQAAASASKDEAALPLVRDPRQLVAVVGGIISYTRWPVAPSPIRLCVLGNAGLVEQARSGLAATGQRPVQAQAVKPDADFQHDCDVVYVTAIPPDNARMLLRRVVGSPVLTVGEGAEFCSDGGMFCLDASGLPVAGHPKPRFSANLDAIARSGLRVNPQVLLLAKVPKVSPP